MVKIVAQNKKASFEYFIMDRFEAGIQLLGSEIKSIRLGKVNINDAFISFKNGQMYVTSMHISKYELSNRFNHDETRVRKLLLHRSQIDKLYGQTREQGFTLIVLKIYIKDGFAKLEIALAKGKKNYDKRASLKEKDQKMRLQKSLRER